MPSKTYDNAWLRAREQPAREFTRDIMHTPEEQARRKALSGDEGRQDQFISEAQQFLSGSRLDPVNVRDVAETDRRIAENTQRQSEQVQATGGRESMLQRPSLRGLSRGAEVLGQAAQGASLPLAFINPLAAAGVYAAGEIAQAPENIWQGIENPDEGMGVGEGALRVGGLLLGARGARPKAPAVRGVSDANRPLGPSRYSSAVGQVDNPNFQRAGEEIDRLPGAWQQFAGGKAARKPSTPATLDALADLSTRASGVTPEDVYSSLGLNYGQDLAVNTRTGIPTEFAGLIPESAYAGTMAPALNEQLTALMQASQRAKTIRDRAAAFRSRPRDIR